MRAFLFVSKCFDDIPGDNRGGMSPVPRGPLAGTTVQPHAKRGCRRTGISLRQQAGNDAGQHVPGASGRHAGGAGCVDVGLPVRRSHDGVCPLSTRVTPCPVANDAAAPIRSRCSSAVGMPSSRDISPDAGSARFLHRAASRFRNHRPRTVYSAHRHPRPAVLPILPTNGEAIWHLLQNGQVPDLRPAHRGFWRAPAPASRRLHPSSLRSLRLWRERASPRARLRSAAAPGLQERPGHQAAARTKCCPGSEQACTAHRAAAPTVST